MAQLMLLCLGLFILSLGYSLYLAWHGEGEGEWKSFYAVATSLAMVTQTLRYHFWLFQIKQRRLDCCVRDWLYSNFYWGYK